MGSRSPAISTIPPRPGASRTRRAQDCLALERCDAQLRRRPPQERIDEEELVEGELAGPSGGREPGLDFERRASARWERPLGCDPAAGDEERTDVTRLLSRK